MCSVRSIPDEAWRLAAQLLRARLQSLITMDRDRYVWSMADLY